MREQEAGWSRILFNELECRSDKGDNRRPAVIFCFFLVSSHHRWKIKMAYIEIPMAVAMSEIVESIAWLALRELYE